MSNLVRNVFAGLTRPSNTKQAAANVAANCVSQSQIAEQALTILQQVTGGPTPVECKTDAAFPIFAAHHHHVTGAQAAAPHLNLNMPAF